MAELLEEQRETWGTRGGFVLAAVGSAVGLGNLWGFPYKLYDSGGGAFLVPYIIGMVCIGIPLLILEFSLGHFTQRAAPNAFGRCNKRLEFVGWWGILLGFVIIMYYPVILAYCFSFLYFSAQSIINGTALPWAGSGIEGVENAKTFFNETYLHKIDGPGFGNMQWHILTPLIISWVLMYFCIFKGVKLVGKIVWLTVPLPFLMLIVLAIRGLTLEGAMDGLVYYLDPDWSQLAKPTTWRLAFGQVFFSLSLAYGVMLTYASFLHRKSDLNNNAAIICFADLGTSFVGGIAIFATLGGMAFVTQQSGNGVGVADVVDGGPGLAFIAFPYALAQLPGAAWWSLIFFFTLVTLGIDSAFSITESVLAGLVDKTGWKRSIVLPAMTVVGLAFGLVFVTQSGLNWLYTIDGFINGTWGIAFLGLLECVALSWFYRIETLRSHANERSDWKLGVWWNYAIRLVIPIVLGTLFIWSLIDDVTKEGGFLKTPDGEWIVFNCVGLCVMAMVPIVSIALSLVKSPVYTGDGHGVQKTITYHTSYTNRVLSIVAFLMAMISAAVLIVIISVHGTNIANMKVWMCYALVIGVAAVLLANYQMAKLDKSNIAPTVFNRFAGVIGTLDISACIALTLVTLTGTAAKAPRETAAKGLTSTSYIILAVACLLIAGGLSWCFWRAMTASSDEDKSIQYPSS